jgi:hypothetical protein
MKLWQGQQVSEQDPNHKWLALGSTLLAEYKMSLGNRSSLHAAMVKEFQRPIATRSGAR